MIDLGSQGLALISWDILLKHDRNSIPALALYRFSVLQLFGNKVALIDPETFKIDTDIISVDDGTSWFMKHLRNDTAAYKVRERDQIEGGMFDGKR
eukprot:2081378-Rhodomonas_salina.1